MSTMSDTNQYDVLSIGAHPDDVEVGTGGVLIDLVKRGYRCGIVILTPEGQISRYFYGIDFPARDLRLGLVEAADNEIGSPVDQLLLTCYHYDPVAGEYTLVIMDVIRIIGLLTVAVIGVGLFFLLRRDRKSSLEPGSV